MKYKIVKGHSSEDLETKIYLMLAEGWKLQGGVSVYLTYGGTKLFQAMVKE